MVCDLTQGPACQKPLGMGAYWKAFCRIAVTVRDVWMFCFWRLITKMGGLAQNPRRNLIEWNNVGRYHCQRA